jgi:hypothetical protein
MEQNKQAGDVNETEYRQLQDLVVNTMVETLRDRISYTFGLSADRGLRILHYLIVLPRRLARQSFFADQRFWLGLVKDQSGISSGNRYFLKLEHVELAKQAITEDPLFEKEAISLQEMSAALNCSAPRRQYDDIPFAELFFLAAMEHVLFTSAFDTRLLKLVIDTGATETGYLNAVDDDCGGHDTDNYIASVYERIERMLNRL